MVAEHVGLWLHDCLMLVVITVLMLKTSIEADRIFRRRSERFTVMVHRQLTDKLRPLLASMLHIVLVTLQQARDWLHVSISKRLPRQQHVRALVFQVT